MYAPVGTYLDEIIRDYCTGYVLFLFKTTITVTGVIARQAFPGRAWERETMDYFGEGIVNRNPVSYTLRKTLNRNFYNKLRSNSGLGNAQ